MARYNKIFLGPVEKNKPQACEALGDVALKPGRLVVLSSGKFVLAGASTVGKVYIVQDNYLALKGVDDDWLDEDRVTALELMPDELYAGRIANGVAVVKGVTALTPGANGTLAVASTSDLIIGYAHETHTASGEELIAFRPTGGGYLSAAS